MNPSAEAELVARCRKGEAEAWNQLFDFHYGPATRFLFQLSPDFTPEDVEEIAHHQQRRTSDITVRMLRTDDLAAEGPPISSIRRENQSERVFLTVVHRGLARMELNMDDSQQVTLGRAVDIEEPEARVMDARVRAMEIK